MGRQVGLLTGAILLLIGCLVAEKLARLLEDFYFARFEQNITLDIQQDLIDRVLHFPKSFFDDQQTGYLQSRLTEDVDGIRWFFSSTIVHVISNVLRFIRRYCLFILSGVAAFHCCFDPLAGACVDDSVFLRQDSYPESSSHGT